MSGREKHLFSRNFAKIFEKYDMRLNHRDIKNFPTEFVIKEMFFLKKKKSITFGYDDRTSSIKLISLFRLDI